MTHERPGGVDPRGPLDVDASPFWESAREHALAIQRCGTCGVARFPPRRICPRCHSEAARWTAVSGAGRVYVSLVVHRTTDARWQARVPFNLSIVELDEGVRMWSNVTGCDPAGVRVGERVRLVYDDVAQNVTVPRSVRLEPGTAEEQRHDAGRDRRQEGP